MSIVSNFTSSIMQYLLAALGLVLLLLLLISLRQPLLAKLGARNIPRRPTQSWLIVLGLTLSTIIIMISLSTGDTLNYSVQAQAVEAYGAIDEVLSPPILATLTQLGVNPDASSEDATQSDLLEGGATSVLSLLEQGLPGIDMERYQELRTQVEDEPLIDGVAPSIIFPTIIRDNSSGQGEPFGFIFAVDEDYQETFGLQSIQGEAVDVTGLRSGAGNFFETATQLFSLVTGTTQDIAARLGYEDLTISDMAMGIAAVGAAITSVQSQSGDGLSAENFDLTELTGIDLESLGIDPETVNINQLGDNLLSAVNLNVLGTEIDRVLGRVGLEIRHGDVYLNRLGAEKLNARVGDIVEIYIGPIPLPYRVRDIVDGAGPMAAVAPVVVMPLSEAQRLLFMGNRINAVLVSNQGDAFAGMRYTNEVNQRLRVLALSDEATRQMVSLLREPEVRYVLDQQITEAAEEDIFNDNGDGPPPFIADLINSVIPIGSLTPNLKTLQQALDQAGISPELRRVLADRNVQLWLSNLSGLSAAKNDELERAVRALTELDLLEPLSKQTVATAASVGGLAFSTVFSLFGIFSILAGVLLIFLIFVMLATERKSEMGMARAIGVQRGQLVQMFVTEGMLYDLAAAAFGVLLGLLVSYAMVGFINNLVNDVTGQVGGALGAQSGFFRFRFNVAPASIVIAYCLGVLLTFFIVTIASWRVSRLNIVAAIRDLPESSVSQRRSWFRRGIGIGGGPLLVAAALWLLFFSGLEMGPGLVQLGASLLLFGVTLTLNWLLSFSTLRRETRGRICYSLLGAGLLVVWTLSWERWSTLLGTNVIERDPSVAVLSIAMSGPLIILGAILVVMYNADSIFWAMSRLLGGIGYLTPVLKTAIAYPLNARFRTGMAMLLFAMIISTVVIMSIVIQATQTLVSPDDERYAGFEIAVNFSLLSFFNPISDLRAEIERHPDFAKEAVAAVARISQSSVLVDRVRVDNIAREESSLARTLELTGLNSEYIEQAQKYYSFQLRAPEYASDAEVWQALAERQDVAIVSSAMLEDASNFEDTFEDQGDSGRGAFDLGLRQLPGVTSELSTLPPVELSLRAESPERQAKMTVQVIGVLEQTETLAAGRFQVNEMLIEQLTGEAPTNASFYVKAAEGFDASQVALDLESAFISGGLNATLSAESFAIGQKVTRGVLRLFQGFMALGLLVGIAALGVISSRMVVERRQQIGMLRAIGYQSNMVAFSFLLEASFIALCGIFIGTAAGVIIGQNVIGTLYNAISDEAFATPWVQIGLIVLLTYLCSLLTTLLPAFQASRIYPAEALRYE